MHENIIIVFFGGPMDGHEEDRAATEGWNEVSMIHIRGSFYRCHGMSAGTGAPPRLHFYHTTNDSLAPGETCRKII